ncbi:MAG: RNA-binding protein [bacterium]
MATKLYVGNLSFEATEDELRNAFAAIGQVVSCDLIMDRFTNKPRGFAFVQMSTQDEANKAVAELNGKDFMGRALRVNEARPQSDRPRDDFGGGGGGGGRGGDRGGRRDFGRDSR